MLTNTTTMPLKPVNFHAAHKNHMRLVDQYIRRSRFWGRI